jgi:hypothetical protein
MLFIYDDDKRSYCGKSLLPFGLRRRSQRGSRDFYHGLLGRGIDTTTWTA